MVGVDRSLKGFIYELGATGRHVRRMGTLPGVVELHLNMIRHHNDLLRDMFLLDVKRVGKEA